MRGAESRAREHRDREPRAHAHVDPDRRALAYAEGPEPVRRLDDLVEELRVRDRGPLALGLALVVVGDLLALASLDVAVEAVVGDVQLPAAVPPRPRQLPLEQRRERLEPGDPLASLSLPELLERDVVDVGLRVRLGGEVGGRRVATILVEEGLDRDVGQPLGSRS